MENTVTISLNHYNELRDFKKKIEEEFCYSITIDRFCHEKLFITTDEAIKEIAKANETLCSTLNFKSESDRLISELNHINSLKKMSIWEFLKWRES